MRPDIEDFEELNIPADEAPRSRAMSWLVLGVAIAGFGALAYYAYHSGTESMENGNVLMVEAEDTPIKEQPLDPQGEQFANQEKTIYEVISPSAEPKVEKLLPEPEKPVIAPQEVAAAQAPEPVKPAPTTFVNKALSEGTKLDAVKPAPAPAAEPTKPATLVVPAPVAVPQPATPAAVVAEVKKPVAPKVIRIESAPAATPALAAKVEEVKAAPAPAIASIPAVEMEAEAESSATQAVVKQEPTNAEKPLEKPAAGGTQVQLGAYKSEQEAQAAWKKISAKFPAVLGGSPSIIKAELDNGTFYRLRTAVSDAKAACAKLSAKGQACFAVK